MAYMVVKGQPVFLHTAARSKVYKEAFRDKDKMWRLGFSIAGFPHRKEAERLIWRTLRSWQVANPQAFRSQYVEFDMLGNEAQRDVWDLLYDYCCYTGAAQLADTRDAVQAILADWVDDTLNYPMGRVFLLRHRGGPSWPFKKKRLDVVIDTTQVVRVAGTLGDFVIFGHQYDIRCGLDISVTPPVQGANHPRGHNHGSLPTDGMP